MLFRSLDYNYSNIKGSYRSSQEILDFIHYYSKNPLDNSYGFSYLPMAIGFVHDTLNRAIFPTDGGAQRLSILGTPPVFGNDSVNFFKASYKAQYYFPLAEDLTLMLMGEVAYGDGYNGTPSLPFWENYFAGGPQVMRGFYPSSLGPRTIPNALGQGGNLSLGGASKLVG